LSHLRRNTVAYVSLFVALSSTGYAGVTRLLPRNSVGTKQVINGSLLNKDFKKGQLPRGLRGIRGATGQAGPQGIRGATGQAGPRGLPGPAARPILWNYAPASRGDDKTMLFGGLGPFTLKAECLSYDPGFGQPSAEIYVTSSVAGHYQLETLRSDDDGGPAPSTQPYVHTTGGTFAPNSETYLALASILDRGHYERTVVRAVVVSDDGHALGLDVHLIGDFRAAIGSYGSCSFDGVATYAP